MACSDGLPKESFGHSLEDRARGGCLGDVVHPAAGWGLWAAEKGTAHPLPTHPCSTRISDIRLFIVDARPAMAATSFVLMTTFPNKELADENQTLKEANLLNAVIVQRLT